MAPDSENIEISVRVEITHSSTATATAHADHGDSVVNSVAEVQQKVARGMRSFVILEPDLPSANGFGDLLRRQIQEETTFVVRD